MQQFTKSQLRTSAFPTAHRPSLAARRYTRRSSTTKAVMSTSVAKANYIDEGLERLKSKKAEWVTLPLATKIQLLKVRLPVDPTVRYLLKFRTRVGLCDEHVFHSGFLTPFGFRTYCLGLGCQHVVHGDLVVRICYYQTWGHSAFKHGNTVSALSLPWKPLLHYIAWYGIIMLSTRTAWLI